MHVILIHNPSAGDGDRREPSLRQLLRRFGHTVDVFSTGDAGWREKVDGAADLVVAAGGDGTVRKVAIAVNGRHPVAILPFGTANNISAALGIASFDAETLVAGWDNPAHHACDLGIATGPWGTRNFLESVGVGLVAEGMTAIDEGPAGYVNQLDEADARITAALEVFCRLLDRLRSVAMSVTINDRTFTGDYLLLEALNFGVAGPNLHLAPDADPADGKLDVVLADEGQRSELSALLSNPRSRETGFRPPLQIHQASQIMLRGFGFQLHLDDKLIAVEGSAEAPAAIELSVAHAAVTFVVPRR